MIATEAVRDPTAVGENVKFSVHEALTANVAGLMGQLSFSGKSPGLAPVTAILEMLRTPGPSLVRVTGGGERLTPESETGREKVHLWVWCRAKAATVGATAVELVQDTALPEDTLRASASAIKFPD